MFQSFIIKKLLNFGFFILMILISHVAKADLARCKDPEFQKMLKNVAQEEGVNYSELLSIVAHESKCHFFVIAWNEPGKPETAQAKYFESKNETEAWANNLIQSGQYSIDIGVGQINYQAHIKPKGWALNEVLDPATALHKVAQVLKERGWGEYHSSNPVFARKWKRYALQALEKVEGVAPTEINQHRKPPLIIHRSKQNHRIQNSKLVFVFSQKPSQNPSNHFVQFYQN